MNSQNPNSSAERLVEKHRILRQKIEALRNDSNYEQLQEELQIEQTLADLNQRISEGVEVLQGSQESRLSELEQIIENLENNIETREFIDKFEVAQKITQFLASNPEARLENLQPSDFTDKPELQSAENWQNILEDVRRGREVRQLLENPKFDISRPETWLDGAGNLLEDAGSTIQSFVRENPKLAVAGAIGLGVAGIWMIFSEGGLIKKVLGAAGVSAAGLLGFEAWGTEIQSGILDRLENLGIPRSVTDFFRNDEEENENNENSAERDPRYGEMMPLSEAIGNYRADAEEALRPVGDFLRNNSAGMKVLAVAGFSSSEEFRSAVTGLGSMTVETAAKIARLPIRAVSGYPITSIFAVTAFLMSYENIQSAVGGMMVPKDTEQLKIFLREHFRDGAERIQNLDLPNVSDAQLDAVAEILTGSLTLPPTGEIICDLSESLLESFALSPTENIQIKNSLGINHFARIIERADESSNSAALAAVRILQNKIRNNESIAPNDIESLRTAVESIGITIIEEDNRIKWLQRDENNVIHGPTSLCVDPSLSAERQAEVAHEFFIESENSFLGGLSAFPATAGSAWEDIRLRINDSFFENVETETEFGVFLERKLKEGCILSIVGGIVSLVSEGAAEKFILGPANILDNLCNLMPGGRDFSMQELAIEYADGILPVAFFGTASALFHGNWRDVVKGKVLLRSAVYPFDLARTGFSQIVRPLISSRSPRAVLENLNIQTTEAFRGFIQRSREIISNQAQNHLGVGLDSWQSAGDLRRLSEAKRIISEARLSRSPATREHCLERLHKIVDNTSLEESFFGRNGVFGTHQNVNLERFDAGLEMCDERKRQINQNRAPEAPEITRTAETPEAAREHLRGVDEEIVATRETCAENTRRLFNEAAQNGIPVNNPTLRERVRTVNQTGLEKIRGLLARRGEFLTRVPTEWVKRFHFETPQIRNFRMPRLRGHARGIIGVGVTIAAAFGLSAMIDYASGNEALAAELEQIAGTLQSNDGPETPDENIESMSLVVDYFNAVDQKYDDLFAAFSPDNLSIWNENEIQIQVEHLCHEHAKIIGEVRQFFLTNQEAIQQFYREHPDLEETNSVGKLFNLGRKDDEIILEFADEDDFRSELYEKVDYVNNHLEELLAGEEITTTDEILDAGKYLVPGWGTGLDAADAYRNFSRGNYGDAIASTAWAVVGGVTDALFFIGVGAAAKAAITGVRTANAAARVSRVVRAARVVESGRFQAGMMGADVFRPLLRPSLSGQITIAL